MLFYIIRLNQNHMNLKQSLVIATLFSLLGLTSWEMYWRSQGKLPDIDDDKNLWADQRSKVDHLKSDDVVLTGSSRILFNIQIYEWEKATGKLPIQLATVGSSPLPIFRDIVENTSFAGTIVVGVTPGLFFGSIDEKSRPWARPKSKIDHYYKRTYAQKLNHFLSFPFQKNFVFVSAHEEEWADDIDLKSLMKQISVGNRLEKPSRPPFYKFDYIDGNRNNRMSDRTATDTTFAGTVKKVWMSMSGPPKAPQRDSTISFFIKYAQKFTQRGGKIILIQSPASGKVKERELEGFPRKDFWDVLVAKSGLPAIHYEDYEELKGFECPEWSHLSAPDAEKFTISLINILSKENLLTNTKSK